MATLQENIDAFLRDGQYRLGEITNILNNQIYDEDSREFKKLDYQRRQIWLLIHLLYSGYRDIQGGEYFGFYANFTEEELNEEIERVRNEVQVSEIPWVSYGQRTIEIVNRTFGQEDGEVNLENSTPGYLARYKNEDTLEGYEIPKDIGWVSPSITEYFQRNTEWGYILHPTYTDAEWTAENPLLVAGEIGFEINGSGVVIGWKVGPGRWNDLSYFGDALYTETETSNPIGDAQGDLSGRTTAEILALMLNPYVVPVISSLQNNAGGSFGNDRILEIGESVSGTVSVTFSVSDSGNLEGSNPINVDAGDIFSNEGDFPNGQIDLTLVAALNPSETTTYQIMLKATHTNGETGVVSTFIRFYPKIISGVSNNANITASEMANIAAKQTFITNNFNRDYSFSQAGYLYIAIPAMLNPSGLLFTDISNPNSPFPMDMTDLGQLTVNNGVGQYAYQIFRSTFLLTVNSTVIRVST